MSAYVVSRGHIRFLVDAALRMRRYQNMETTSWHWNGAHRTVRDEEPGVGFYTPTELGQLLWTENVRSVCDRYPDTGPAEIASLTQDLPGPIGENYLYEHPLLIVHASINPVDVLKSLSCYEYQACEHDEWEASEAKTFCDSLRHRAINCLPGHEDAPWGSPEAWETPIPEVIPS